MAYTFKALGTARGFFIYNGLSQWPRSDALTCWNPNGDRLQFGKAQCGKVNFDQIKMKVFNTT